MAKQHYGLYLTKGLDFQAAGEVWQERSGTDIDTRRAVRWEALFFLT